MDIAMMTLSLPGGRSKVVVDKEEACFKVQDIL